MGWIVVTSPTGGSGTSISEECIINRSKIVREGHFLSLCKSYSVLDVHSKPFEDLLTLLYLFSLPDKHFVQVSNQDDGVILATVSDSELPIFCTDIDIDSDLNFNASHVDDMGDKDCGSDRAPRTACATMLGNDIHFELMRLLKFEVKHSVNCTALQLLCQLLSRLDKTHLKRLMEVSTLAGSRRSSGSKPRSNSVSSASPFEKTHKYSTPPRRSNNLTTPPNSSESRKQQSGGINQVQAMMMLIQDHCAHQPAVSAHILSVFARILSQKCFRRFEQEAFARQLVGEAIDEPLFSQQMSNNLGEHSIGVNIVGLSSFMLVEALILCLKTYTCELRDFPDLVESKACHAEKRSRKEAVLVSLLYCMTIMSNLAVKVNSKTRYRLLFSCSSYCIKLISGCNFVVSHHEENKQTKNKADDCSLEYKLLIFTCEAFSKMLFWPMNDVESSVISTEGFSLLKTYDEVNYLGADSSINESVKDVEMEVINTLGTEKIYMLCKLLRYHHGLFFKSLCCRFRAPSLNEISGISELESCDQPALYFSHTPKFCIIDRNPSLSLVKPIITKVSVSQCKDSLNTAAETAQYGESKSYELGIDARCNGIDEYEDDKAFFFIIRQMDEEPFLTWVLNHGVLDEHDLDCLDFLNSPKFPLLSIELSKGVVYSSTGKVQRICEPPLLHQLSNEKAFRLNVNPLVEKDCVGSTVQISLNGLRLIPPSHDYVFSIDMDGNQTSDPQEECCENVSVKYEEKDDLFDNERVSEIVDEERKADCENVDLPRRQKFTASNVSPRQNVRQFSSPLVPNDMSLCPDLSFFVVHFPTSCEQDESEVKLRPDDLYDKCAVTERKKWTVFVTQLDHKIPDVSKLQVLPTIWQFCNEENIRIVQKSCVTQLISLPNCPPPGFVDIRMPLKKPIIAAARGYSAGVFLYQFALSHDENCYEGCEESGCGDVEHDFVVGICTNDTMPLVSPHNISSGVYSGSMFSLQYYSSGRISVCTCTGPINGFPCVNMVPPIINGDVIHVEISHEARGCVRVFHNAQLIYELEEFRRFCFLPAHTFSSLSNGRIGIGPFVSFSEKMCQRNASALEKGLGSDGIRHRKTPVISLDQFASAELTLFRVGDRIQDNATKFEHNCMSDVGLLRNGLDWSWLLSSFSSLSSVLKKSTTINPVRTMQAHPLYANSMYALIRAANYYDCSMRKSDVKKLVADIDEIGKIICSTNGESQRQCFSCLSNADSSNRDVAMIVKDNCYCELNVRYALIAVISVATEAWRTCCHGTTEDSCILRQISVSLLNLLLLCIGCNGLEDNTLHKSVILTLPDFFSIGAAHVLSEIVCFWLEQSDGTFTTIIIRFALHCLNDYEDEPNPCFVADLLLKSGTVAVISRAGVISADWKNSSLVTVCSAIVVEVFNRVAGCKPKLVPFSFVENGDDSVSSQSDERIFNIEGKWERKSLQYDMICSQEECRHDNIITGYPWYFHRLQQQRLLTNPSKFWSTVLVKDLDQKISFLANTLSCGQTDEDNMLCCDAASLLHALFRLCLTPALFSPEDFGFDNDAVALPSLNAICFDMRVHGISHLWLCTDIYKCPDEEANEVVTDFAEGVTCFTQERPLSFDQINSIVSNWQEGAYCALLRSDFDALISILSEECSRGSSNANNIEELLRQKDAFSGYGPWIFGHPMNNNEGLILPCSVLSAANQLCSKGYKSWKFFSQLSQFNKKCSTMNKEVFDDNAEAMMCQDGSPYYNENIDEVKFKDIGHHNQDQVSNMASDGESRPLRSYRSREQTSPSRQSSSPTALALSTTTAATIAAIRSLVRDEQNRMLQLTAAVGLNVDSILRSLRLQSLAIEHQRSEMVGGSSIRDYDGSPEATNVGTGYLVPDDTCFPLSLYPQEKTNSKAISPTLSDNIETLSPVTTFSRDNLSCSCKALSGPRKFLYTKSDGSKAHFDASYEACSEFGLFHGQTVASHSFPLEFGVGVVVGVLQGYLWIHWLDRSLTFGVNGIVDGVRRANKSTMRYFGGASYREDNWRFADLYVVDVFSGKLPEKSQNLSSSTSHLNAVGASSWGSLRLTSSFASCGCSNELANISCEWMCHRNILPGDRVRRGKDWQWSDQDGEADNLGTVIRIGMCSCRYCPVKNNVDEGYRRGPAADYHGCWVFVEWDAIVGETATSRNSYRWGLDGKFDLEKVHDDFDKCPAELSNESMRGCYDDIVEIAMAKSGAPFLIDFNVVHPYVGEANRKKYKSIYEALTVDENIRQMLWKTSGYVSLLMKLLRLYYSESSTEGTIFAAMMQNFYSRLLAVILLHVSYDTPSALTADFTLADVNFFLCEVEKAACTTFAVDETMRINGINCAKLLSVLSSSGTLFRILNKGTCQEEIENMSLMNRRIVQSLAATLKLPLGCPSTLKLTLVLSMLRYLHDMVLFAVGVYSFDSPGNVTVELFRRKIWDSFFGEYSNDVHSDTVVSRVNDLICMLLFILKDPPSASSLTLTVDVVIALVDDGSRSREKRENLAAFSPPNIAFTLLMRHGLDELLISLTEKLDQMCSNPGTLATLRIVTNAMKIIHVQAQRLNAPSNSSSTTSHLFAGLLKYATKSRNFGEIVDYLWWNLAEPPSTLIQCINVLLGGTKRHVPRPPCEYSGGFVTDSDVDSLNDFSTKSHVAKSQKAPVLWRKELVVGSRIDAKDKSHHWYEAVVRDTRRRSVQKVSRHSSDSDVDEYEDGMSDEEEAACDWHDLLGGQKEVFVHYCGWGDKYDEWIPCSSDRLQCANTETGHWRQNLRVDDPIEILCLHYENPSGTSRGARPDVKRRWFRGVVAKIETLKGGKERLLVIYDKRGCREERWVDIDEREEICVVGTHVPSSLLGPLGYNGDVHQHSHLLMKYSRKMELLENGSMELFLNLLNNQMEKLILLNECDGMMLGTLEVMKNCLEALQFLLPMSPLSVGHSSFGGGCGEYSSNSDGDNMMNSSTRLRSLSVLNPAKIFCKCIDHLQKSRFFKFYPCSLPKDKRYKLNTTIEAIVDLTCDIIASLSISHDGQQFSVGDAIEAQWRRTGNVSFPGRITRIRDLANVNNSVTTISGGAVNESITFDISYDDGDREERVPMERIRHRSGVSRYNSADFLTSFVSSGGPTLLISLLTEYGQLFPEDICVSILSILSSLMETSGECYIADIFWKDINFTSANMGWFEIATCAEAPESKMPNSTDSIPYAEFLFHLLSKAACVKSSSRLIVHCLKFYRVLAESNVVNKNRVFAIGGHSLSILCLSAFPHHPKLLCQALKLLTAIASKDGAIEVPRCNASSGITISNSNDENLKYFWQSEDRPPSEAFPHWIDVYLPKDQRWRELQIFLSDHVNSSPELIAVKYLRDGAHASEIERAPQYVEIKRANISAVEGWVTLVNSEEVSKILTDAGNSTTVRYIGSARNS